jgi:hypothetical protein
MYPTVHCYGYGMPTSVFDQKTASGNHFLFDTSISGPYISGYTRLKALQLSESLHAPLVTPHYW